MQSPQKYSKGQLSLVNIVGILVGFIIFFFLFLPVYQPIANTTIAFLDPAWQFYTITIVLIELIPLVVIIALVLQILSYAQPRFQ